MLLNGMEIAERDVCKTNFMSPYSGCQFIKGVSFHLNIFMLILYTFNGLVFFLKKKI